MKQQLTEDNKTLWEIHHDKNPTVWETGRKYDPITDSYNEVNGRPDFTRKKEGKK